MSSNHQVWVYKVRLENDADILRRMGSALTAISRVIIEDSARQCSDEAAFLNPIDLEGLMMAVDLFGYQLQMRAEKMEELAASQGEGGENE